MSSQKQLTITAKKTKTIQNRICLGDIFSNIEIIENIKVVNSKIIVDKISFPYVICLNQECDLNNDFELNQKSISKDSCLLHIAIAPAFNFEKFKNGSHWGKIFDKTYNIDNKAYLIKDNEIQRFHYLKFPDVDMPELIIDFKHFFTVNREFLYENISNRICSIDDLFKEKLSQRFSNFISRIGLPV